MKPIVLLDPHWRAISELFNAADLERLHTAFDVVWGRDEPISEADFKHHWPSVSALVSCTPEVDSNMLSDAPNLKCIIEVSGAFPESIDYTACAARNIDVLSCAPGFRDAVAEMGLAMALSCSRGLFTEHEAFRRGTENWLADNTQTDFTLRGANIGFIGFGQIAQALSRLLVPFNPRMKAYDPWLSDDVASDHQVELSDFDEVLADSRCLFVCAVPTKENKGLISAEALAKLQDHAIVVVLSRAHLVDFDALTSQALSGRLRVASDVYPEEPVPSDHPIRQARNALLSPHRAAAIANGRQLIGEMIVDDLLAIFSGNDKRRLLKAEVQRMQSLAGATDSSDVEAMASTRST